MAFKKEEVATEDWEYINSQIAIIKKDYGITKARLARDVGVLPKTFDDWSTGIMTCKYPKMLSLALKEYIRSLNERDK